MLFVPRKRYESEIAAFTAGFGFPRHRALCHGEPPSRSGKDTIARMLQPGPIETRIPLQFLDQKSKEREEWNFDKERAAVHLALPDKLIKRRSPKSYLLVAFPAINQYSTAEMTRTVFDEIVGNLSKARLGIYLPSHW
uniref:Uncharacterized protein n=1 Tax=Vespula pensylvanica TaxID=30213 RepID=A0A834N202_VESPE|nr:hypothetical protein H0235_017103 [Vespula pensylvanica]